MHNTAMMASIILALAMMWATTLRANATPAATAERAHALRQTDPGRATRLFDRNRVERDFGRATGWRDKGPVADSERAA